MLYIKQSALLPMTRELHRRQPRSSLAPHLFSYGQRNCQRRSRANTARQLHVVEPPDGAKCKLTIMPPRDRVGPALQASRHSQTGALLGILANKSQPGSTGTGFTSASLSADGSAATIPARKPAGEPWHGDRCHCAVRTGMTRALCLAGVRRPASIQNATSRLVQKNPE